VEDRGAGGESGTHGATVLSTAGGIRHYVTFLNSGPTGIAADDGRILWRYEKTRGRTVSYTPVVRDELILAASGYGWGMALLKLVPETGGLAAVEQYHQEFNFSPFQDNTVVIGDSVYAVRGPGQLVCLELLTGKLVWEQPAPSPSPNPITTSARWRSFTGTTTCTSAVRSLDDAGRGDRQGVHREGIVPDSRT
jgi:outer membrane protein assembly factor BamB